MVNHFHFHPTTIAWDSKRRNQRWVAGNKAHQNSKAAIIWIIFMMYKIVLMTPLKEAPIRKRSGLEAEISTMIDCNLYRQYLPPPHQFACPPADQCSRHATRKVPWVMGIFFFSPPILVISSSFDIPCITLPAPRNNSPLKNAWVIRWKIPAVIDPRPRAIIIYPSCEHVE